MKTRASSVAIVVHLLIAALWLCTDSAQLGATDYPQWRGPERDGYSKENRLLKEWPKDGPQLLWRNSEMGSGYSCPAVVGEHLYILGNSGLENEFVQALTIKEGKKLWSTRLGNVGNPDQNPKFPAARSTPTIDGESFY